MEPASGDGKYVYVCLAFIQTLQHRQSSHVLNNVYFVSR
jgi:hypothetical protein